MGTCLMKSISEWAQVISSKLSAQQDELKLKWQTPQGSKTRYFILDDVLPVQDCHFISQGFPKDYSQVNKLNNFREKKKTLGKVYLASKQVEHAIYAFQDQKVLKLIEAITGFEKLEADPKLYAGGISMMDQGDFLNPHIDNSHNSTRNSYRRLNLLYYVAADWKKANGGNLELWDSKVTSPLELTSKCNRLIVMETNQSSWHSVNPVKVNQTRQCVSNYYFSKHSPEKHDYYHVTSFLGRPDEHLKRFWGRIDNSLRQFVASTTGISRGKSKQNDKVI